MPITPECFAEFSDFIDYRQDQLIDVMTAIHTLRSTRTDDMQEMLRILEGIDAYKLLYAYQNKCNEVSRGNNNLVNSISRVSFNRFKPVIGADDYV